MFVCCECCVLSGRGLCDGLITRPEEPYRLWRLVCDQETSKIRRLGTKARYRAVKIQSQWVIMPGKQTNIIKHKDKFGKAEAEFCVRKERNTCEYSGRFAVGTASFNAGSSLQHKM
jgi:hypothetical protein